MNELPKGWVATKWNDITAVDGFRRGPFGGNLKKSCFVDEGYAVYEQYAPINNDCRTFRYFVTKDKFNELASFQVDNGDFLISCSGTMGRITCVPEGAPLGVINQALLRIRLQQGYIYPEYFLWLFKSPMMQSLVLNKSVGGAIQNLAAVKELKEIPLPLAPLPEQKRIVEKLDEVLAQVDTIKARLDGIPDLLKRFRQSVLASAVSGKLTEEWRQSHAYESKVELASLQARRQRKFEQIGKKDKELKRIANAAKLEELPSNWIYSTLDPFLDIERSGMKTGPFGSLLKKHEHQDSGVPVLGIENISAGTFIEGSKIHISDKKAEELASYDVLEGDLLISRSGTVGDICAVPGNLGRMRFSTNLMRVSFLEDAINTAYFCYLFLGSKSVLRQVSELCKGSTRDFLNQKILGSIHYPIPPLPEQKEIVRLVDQYFAFADTIEAQVKKAQARVDNLTQSILAKAFRGELVPQDPNDEPADKLLERIAKARAEAEALAKAAKKAQAAKKRAAKA